MGEGLQAVGTFPRGGGALRQPAYGEYGEQPEIDAQDEHSKEDRSSDGFARWTQWPVLALLTLAEGAWLGALVYAIHRFVLSPL